MTQRTKPEKRQRIVELKLAGHSIREIAKALRVAPSTVDIVWKEWLTKESGPAVTPLKERTAEAIVRMQQVADDCRAGATGATQASDHAAAARYLAIESRTLANLAVLEERLTRSAPAPVAPATTPAGKSAVPAGDGAKVRSIDDIRRSRDDRLARANAEAPAKRPARKRRSGGD